MEQTSLLCPVLSTTFDALCQTIFVRCFRSPAQPLLALVDYCSPLRPGDNWQEISEHVGTKSRAQCILHFIQMPIEDPFLEELEASSTVTTVTDDPLARGKAAGKGGAQNGTEAQGPMTASQLIMQASGGVEGEPLTPFADAGNPVMAQVRREGRRQEVRGCPCRGAENFSSNLELSANQRL
jgi:hypothetical protein